MMIDHLLNMIWNRKYQNKYSKLFHASEKCYYRLQKKLIKRAESGNAPVDSVTVFVRIPEFMYYTVLLDYSRKRFTFPMTTKGFYLYHVWITKDGENFLNMLRWQTKEDHLKMNTGILFQDDEHLFRKIRMRNEAYFISHKEINPKLIIQVTWTIYEKKADSDNNY